MSSAGLAAHRGPGRYEDRAPGLSLPKIGFEHRPRNLLPIRADERALKQLVLNLLSNAFKFTGPKGIIRLCALVSSDGYPTIEVHDNGIGIPESALARVTEAFYQVLVLEPAISSSGRGTPEADDLSTLSLPGAQL
jgi:signal transduction histidine kinase